MNSLSPKEAASLLRQKDNILILTHRRPDGDTTGCAAGLCLALRQLRRGAVRGCLPGCLRRDCV